MTDNYPLLLLPNGQPVRKDHQSEGRATRLQAFGGPYILGGGDLKGATPHPRRADWRDYWEMYEKHPIVFSAINKIVKVCTNTGYDFVPRTSRSDPNEGEVEKLREFFNKQHDLIGELRRIYRDLYIFGDAYLYVIPDRRRRPSKLKRLAPWTMNIKAKNNGEIQFYLQKDPSNPESNAVEFRPHEILHFKLDNPKDDLYGMSPLESLKGDITADLWAATYNRNFFKNGAATGTIIVVKDATDQELERNKQWIREEYVGSDNAHKPIIIAGDVDVKHTSQTHVEMGFLEGRNQIKQRILAVLDVPPAKIGDMETANRSNSKEQDKSFRTESIMPLQYTVEAVINDQFIRNILGIRETIFVHSEADIRDAQEQMDLWKDAVQNGLMNINEVRSKMGLAKIEGGDINYVMTPTGAVPVVDLELYFKLPRNNTDQIPESAHAGDGHAGGSANELAGPSPKPTANTSTGQLPASEKSLAAATASTLGVGTWLKAARTDKGALRQAYAYAMDAVETYSHGLVKQGAQALEKALKTDDDELRIAYIDRAESFLGTFATLLAEEVAA